MERREQPLRRPRPTPRRSCAGRRGRRPRRSPGGPGRRRAACAPGRPPGGCGPLTGGRHPGAPPPGETGPPVRLLPEGAVDAVAAQLLPEAGGAVAALGAGAGQGVGKVLIVQGPDVLQPLGGAADVALPCPLLPELLLEIRAGHGPAVDEGGSPGLGPGGAAGGPEPGQRLFLQIVPGPEGEVQHLFLAAFQERAVGQEDEDAAGLVL